MRVKVFFDGGCRPNPGAMEVAVVVRGHATILRDLGYGTSMDAEWRALIEAVRIARSLDSDDVVLLGDSIGVIDQANGLVRTRAGAAHLATFRALASTTRPRIRYIKRTQNLAGIALNRLHER